MPKSVVQIIDLADAASNPLRRHQLKQDLANTVSSLVSLQRHFL